MPAGVGENITQHRGICEARDRQEDDALGEQRAPVPAREEPRDEVEITNEKEEDAHPQRSRPVSVRHHRLIRGRGIEKRFVKHGGNLRSMAFPGGQTQHTASPSADGLNAARRPAPAPGLPAALSRGPVSLPCARSNTPARGWRWQLKNKS